MLDYAIDRARGMEYRQGQRRIYAVLVDRKGNIIGEGSNSYVKTHPVQAKWAKRVGKEDKVFLHAEVRAIVRARGEPYKLFVARVDHEGVPCIAAPCIVCREAIRESGIQSVEYTV